jgi:NAD dependent epimerase/dehydratase family
MLAARSNGPGDFIHSNIFRAPGSPALLAQLACREVHGFPLPCIFRPTRQSARSAKKDFSRKRLPIGQTHRILRAKHHPSHFVRTLHETYELPTLVANCSNNCGRYHFPEKLIPHVIMKGLAGEPPPVYGERNNIRDWLYVEEHANALTLVLARRGQRNPQCQRTQGARQSACGGERLRPSWTGCRRVWPVHSGG